jgi:hypothetical protein
MWNLVSQFKILLFSLILIMSLDANATKLFYLYKVGSKVVERNDLEKLSNELQRLHCVFDKNSLLVNALSTRHEIAFPVNFFTADDIAPMIESTRKTLINMIRLEKLLLYLKNQTINVTPELKATIEKTLNANNCGKVMERNIFDQLVDAEIFLNARFAKSNLLVTSDEIESFKKNNPQFKQNISQHLGAIKKSSEVTNFILGIFRQITHEFFWGEDI